MKPGSSRGRDLLPDHDRQIGGTATFCPSGARRRSASSGRRSRLLALPLVAIIALDETTFRVALLTTVEFLPFLLFTLPAGVWVDRLRRRPILILGDLGRAARARHGPGCALARRPDDLAAVCGRASRTGICTVFFDVAYQSYLPALVGREQIVEGNSKLEISRSAANIAGPGLAGLLVAALTAPVAILADAISFLVVRVPARR